MIAGYPWNSGTIIGLIIASVVLFALFFVQEHHHKAPILNLKLFFVRNFSVAAVTFFVFGVAMFSVLTYLPLYFQDIRGDAPIISGLFVCGSSCDCG